MVRFGNKKAFRSVPRKAMPRHSALVYQGLLPISTPTGSRGWRTDVLLAEPSGGKL
jgi:hypothetical protein